MARDGGRVDAHDDPVLDLTESHRWRAKPPRYAARSSISWTIPGSTSATSRRPPDSPSTGCWSSRTASSPTSATTPRSRKRHPGVQVTHIKGRLILPGFIDGHVHFPQVRVLGAYGNQLLDWLQNWIFPEELKYSDRNYARDAAGRFFEPCSPAARRPARRSPPATPSRPRSSSTRPPGRNMRVIAGLTGIDRFAPDDTVISPDYFYRETKRLIEQYHRKGRNLYAITPRFAVGCTDEMMERCRKLKEEHHDCWINTHISENPSELRTSRLEFPDCQDYTHVHEKHGLLGPKFTAGHGIWLSNDEFRRFSKAGAAIAFCPLSNLFLGSGLFRLGRATDPEHPVRVTLGCDVGGGNAFSLVRVLEEAYKVGMCNNTMLDGSVNPREQDLAEAERNKLEPLLRLLPGHARRRPGPLPRRRARQLRQGKGGRLRRARLERRPGGHGWHQSLITGGNVPETIDQAAQLLFGIMVCGDDRNVDETWIAGRCA